MASLTTICLYNRWAAHVACNFGYMYYFENDFSRLQEVTYTCDNILETVRDTVIVTMDHE